MPSKSIDQAEYDLLKTENKQLKEQLENVQAYLASHEHIESQKIQLEQLRGNVDENHALFFKRRSQALSDRIDLQLHSVQAKVVYRNPTSWIEFAWINVGENENEKLGLPIIRKNSPVLSYGSVVGIIEKVEKTRSLVRLITDPAFTVSVRVSRGLENRRVLTHALNHLIQQLTPYKEYSTVCSQIHAITEGLSRDGINRYLAKGEIKGGSASLWRSGKKILRGEGFNYDYADEEGPALNLRTGLPYSEKATETTTPLIQTGDLLITTGYDGLFPQGLPVAWVKKVHPIDDASISFNIDAIPLHSDLDRLEHVTILPSISGEI